MGILGRIGCLIQAIIVAIVAIIVALIIYHFTSSSKPVKAPPPRPAGVTAVAARTGPSRASIILPGEPRNFARQAGIDADRSLPQASYCRRQPPATQTTPAAQNTSTFQPPRIAGA